MMRTAMRLCTRHPLSKDSLVRPCSGFGSIRGALFGARQTPSSPSLSSSSISALAPSSSTSSSSKKSTTSSSSKSSSRRRSRREPSVAVVVHSLPFSSTSPAATTSSSFDACNLVPAQLAAFATGNDAEARRALFREAVADAAGALYSTLLTDERASAEVFSSAKIEKLQQKLGFSFPREHSWLLRAALVHKSYKAELGKYAASDLLSWHGDAVLYAMLTESTVAAYPGAGIPDLTAARMCRISRESLSLLAKAVGIDELVAVGKSFQGISGGGGGGGSGGGSNANGGGGGGGGGGTTALSTGMLGEAFEAVLGAVSASGGADAVRVVYFKVAPLPDRLRGLLAETMKSGGGG